MFDLTCACLLLLATVLVDSAHAETSSTNPIFGTVSGFDSGGNDPICWLTKYDLTNAELSSFFGSVSEESSGNDRTFSNSSFSVNSLNQALYHPEQSTDQFKASIQNELLPQCVGSTSLDLKSIRSDKAHERKQVGGKSAFGANQDGSGGSNDAPHDDDQVYNVGKTFDVRFTLTADPNELLQSLHNATPAIAETEQIPVWFRIILCNAQDVAFCHPFILSENEKAATAAAGSDDPGRNGILNSVLTQYADGTPMQGHIIGLAGDGGIDGSQANTFIYTQWVKRSLTFAKPTDDPDGAWQASLDLSMVLPEKSAGVYFVLGHGLLYLLANDESFGYRVDFADTIPTNVIVIRDAPTILQITKEFKILLVVVPGIFFVIAAIIFAFVCRHAKNKVMQLAQADLLIGLCLCSLWTISCTFLWLPTQSIFCRLSLPLVFIPSTMVATILIGRLWRVYMTLMGAASIGRNNGNRQASEGNSSSDMEGGENDATARKRKSRMSAMASSVVSEQGLMEFLAWIAFSRPYRILWSKVSGSSGGSPTRRSSALRQTATRNDTIRLILILSLPQIVLQLFGSIYYESSLWLELNNSQTIGRLRCYDRGGDWLGLAGLVYLAACYALAVLVAWYSRDLPTAFNEKHQIFQTATINGIVCVIIMGLVVVTDNPETSPNITTFLWVILSITLGMVANWLIVMPKIRRVLSGERVVVSSMLRQVNDQSSSEGSNTVAASNRHTYTPAAQYAANQGRTNTGALPPQPSARNQILLQRDDAVPSNVESELYRMKAMLQTVTEKCLHGRPMTPSDWKLLQSRSKSLFTQVSRIECGWSNDDGGDEDGTKQERHFRDEANFDEEEQTTPEPAGSGSSKAGGKLSSNV